MAGSKSDHFDKDLLFELADSGGDLCVSIYMPTIISGDQTRQNSIRFGNLLAESLEKMEKYKAPDDKIGSIRRSLERLRDDRDFWMNQSKGLAVFADPTKIRTYRLDERFDEQCIVDRRFFIRPLIPLAGRDGIFYILALSRSTTKFLKCDAEGFSDLPAPENLHNFEKFREFYETEESLQFHYGGRKGRGEMAPEFHGHAAGEQENENIYLVEYFSKIWPFISREVKRENAILYLAGDEREVGLFMKAARTGYPSVRLLTMRNIASLEDTEIYAMALGDFFSAYDHKRRKALEEFEMLKGREPEKVDTDLTSVVMASCEGRVKTLFVPGEDHLVWGSYDVAGRKLQLQEKDEDQLGEEITNFAAVNCMKNGGEVFALPRPAIEKTPHFQPLAAVFYW